MASTSKSGREPAVRTVVMAPGVKLDEATSRALTELSDQQEARLVAHNQTQTAMRRGYKALCPPEPPPEKPDPKPAADLSGLPALVQWTKLPVFGEWQSTTRAGSGEFRHAVTHVHEEHGLRVANMSDGTHFWGDAHYGDDDPLFFSVSALWHYVLDSDRIPDSPSGRYLSAPPGDAHGRIVGMHGTYSCPFHCDTKTASCRRFFRHSLHQFVNNQWHFLGERSLDAWPIRVRNVEGDSFREHNLPGFMGAPELPFGLVDRGQPVWAQVELRFDIELEGPYAWIGFGPEPSRGVIGRTWGWSARPI